MRPPLSPVVAVTGGAAGIGLAIARRFRAAGARVAIGDLDVQGAGAAAAELGCIALALDVSDAESMRRFVEKVESRLGPIDVLVNNAGVMTVGPFLGQDPAVIRRQFDVNVLGVVNGMRAVLPAFLERRRGLIVNLGSAASRVGVPGLSTYSASKHAVLGLSEAVRAELRGTGVEIAVVMPAFVATELAAGTRPARGLRPLAPEEVGEAVVRLLEKPRFETYLPGRLGPTLNLAAALPRPLRDGLSGLTGTRRVALETPATSRTAYEERIAEQARRAP